MGTVGGAVVDPGNGDERSGAVDPLSISRSAGPGRGDALLVLAGFAAVYLVWGSTYLAIAWAVETVPPFLMIAARCLLAGGALYGWTRMRGGRRPDPGDWRAAAVAGTLLFVTGQAVLAWSETRIASGPAALLVATEPLFVVMLGWRGGRLVGGSGVSGRPGLRTFLALGVGFAGVALMVLPSGGAALDVAGAAAALVASFSWSVGVFRARARPGISSAQLAGMQLLAGGVVLLAVSLVTGEAWGVAPGGPSLRSLLAFFYLVVFGSVVTYGAYVWLLDRVGPARLSTHAYVNPVVAVVLGVMLGGESVTGPLLAAMALILGSVTVLVRRERPRPAPLDGDAAVRAAPPVVRPAPRPAEHQWPPRTIPPAARLGESPGTSGAGNLPDPEPERRVRLA